MKKIIAILLALVLVLSFAACGAESEKTSEPANDEQTSDSTPVETPSEDAPVDANSPAQAVLANFKAKVEAGETDVEAIAAAVTDSELINTMCAVMPMEEGLLNGFGNAEIKGFKKCAMFAPMIGTLPFVGYVFELEEGADIDGFKALLKDSADLRWNICTEADEMVCESAGNFVIFTMAPASFEE